MKYFLHDCNAFDDEKISELYMKFGYEGLGLFYTTLEKIGKQEKPVKTAVLKSQLKVGKKLEKCWKFMEEIGVINTLNGETFNENILKFSEKFAIKKEKNREKISEWRKNQQVTKNVTSYEPNCNHPKVNISKVKENKIKEEEILKDDFVPETWPFEKRNFLKNEQWVYRFCSEKKIDQIALEILMKDFITEIELKTDFKSAKELRYHFTNYFNKLKKDELNNQIRAPEKQSAPLRTAADYLK
jgi:hypothetical protein